MQVGDRVEDVVGMRGVVVGILADRVRVQWAEHTTWVKRSYLTVLQ